jgi:hypothetical protein
MTPPPTFSLCRERHSVSARDFSTRFLLAAVQVEFVSKQILKPGYHVSGSRVETRRFQALWVNCIQLVKPRRVSIPSTMPSVALSTARSVT